MPTFLYWHKARNTPVRYDPAFQKVCPTWLSLIGVVADRYLQCILSYISDSQL